MPLEEWLNAAARRVAGAPAPPVPACGAADLGMAWQGGGFEAFVHGRRPGQAGQRGFIAADAGAVAGIPRSVVGGGAWRI